MSYSHILFQVEEPGIALLTVNRPEKLNALSGELIAELADAFGRVAGEPAIRAAILTGAGEKAVGGGSAYWKYTLAGTGAETWTPRFFYHGCRYLQVVLT